MHWLVDIVTQYVIPLFPLVMLTVLMTQFLQALYTKLFKRPKVTGYPVGDIEVGFGKFGPTIGLIGTLRSVNHDAFVSNVSLDLINSASGLTRSMTWRAFRPYSFGFVPDDSSTWEVASAFSLPVQIPFKYNIMFVDDAFLAAASPQVQDVRAHWEKAASGVSDPARLEECFERFIRQPEISAVMDRLREPFYWSSGKYEAVLNVHTSSPDKIHTKNFAFELKDVDVEGFKGNIARILRAVCGLSTAFRYVHLEYQV